jgi:2-hydroxychromene-2-carboxylate isomerase
MMGFADKQAFFDQRLKAEEIRAKENLPHEVSYFHKVDDPYSYLTASYAGEISKRFNVEVTPILVGDDVSETVHEPSMYDVHCLNDSK